MVACPVDARPAGVGRSRGASTNRIRVSPSAVVLKSLAFFSPGSAAWTAQGARFLGKMLRHLHFSFSRSLDD